MLTTTSLLVYQRYAANNTEPMEWLAVPEWVSQYGPDGIPRNILLEKAAGQSYGFTFEYSADTNHHLVKKPLPNSLAEKGGLRHGDIVCLINGTDVTNLNYDKALSCAKRHEDSV